MATTTPNYGWTVPTSTDLVKDGATAIETLGDAIDASMNTALGTKKAGMVLLNTTSFSAVASQSVNSVFSATYKNYLIELNTSADSNRDLHFRFRASSTDKTTGYYRNNTAMTYSSTTVNGVAGNNIGYHFIGYSWSSGLEASSTIEVSNPFDSGQRSVIHFQTNGGDYWVSGSGFQVDSTSFDGFTIFPNAGNITGSLSVYGYNK
jgi:hypothetical protein